MKEQDLILTYKQRTQEVLALLRRDPSLAKHVFPWGNTLLRAAVLTGQKELVEELLKREADPNVQDRHGRTPLHYAAALFLEVAPGTGRLWGRPGDPPGPGDPGHHGLDLFPWIFEKLTPEAASRREQR